MAAEAQATEFKGAAERCQALEKEVKEKNLLIGKLRHEAVILNEHLTEALRRLRANTSDSNVDRRLVTNLLLQFITTPRADGKRFEMLSLIASVLQWSDDERETAGLQRTNPGSSSSSSTMSPGKMVGIGIKTEGRGHGRSAALANASSTGDEVSAHGLLPLLLNNRRLTESFLPLPTSHFQISLSSFSYPRQSKPRRPSRRAQRKTMAAAIRTTTMGHLRRRQHHPR